MTAALWWHPRAQRPPRPKERAVDYGDPSEPVSLVQYVDPSEPIYVDEAQVTREEVAVEREFADAVGAAEAEGELDEAVDDAFGIPRAARLPLPARSGPRLDREATARVGRRLQEEREELVALRRAGLIDNEEETR